jgi:DNA-binding response OmpR family regulator
LIVLELDLPGIDGLQVAQLIRHGEVAGRHVPIVATTTRHDEEEITRGREVGVDAFLHKPFNGEQLAAALQEALAARPVVRKEMNPV